jgi:hypothetical protein
MVSGTKWIRAQREIGHVAATERVAVVVGVLFSNRSQWEYSSYEGNAVTVAEVISAVIAAELLFLVFFICLARSADAGDHMAELELVNPAAATPATTTPLREQLRVVLLEDPHEVGAVPGVERLDQPMDPGRHHEQIPRRL